MGKINWTRVFIGGLVAGVVVNVLWFGAWAQFVRRGWSAALEAAGRPLPETFGTTVLMVVVGFLLGFTLVWLYAAIRPRYGAGPKTAVVAGVAAWIFLGVIPDVALGSMLRLIPARLWAIDVVETLVVTVVAALLGAWVYKEQGA
jgi:hypothetical protein